MTVLVDSNVIIDVVSDSPDWYDWSVAQMDRLSLNESLAINDVVVAELANSFERFDELDAAVNRMGLDVLPMPRAALFLAGKAHARYRRAGGVRTGVLPDFFIGAQAATEGIRLLTRDAKRYRTYFPTVELIAP